MADINLLPDDFRYKEKRKSESEKKSSGSFDIKFHIPEKEEKAKEKKEKEKTPSIFSKFFSNKKPVALKKEEKPKVRPEEKLKSDASFSMTKPNFKPRAKDEIKFDFKNDETLISDIDLSDLDLRENKKPIEPIQKKNPSVLLASSEVNQHLLKKPSWFLRLRLKFFSKKNKDEDSIKSKPLPKFDLKPVLTEPKEAKIKPPVNLNFDKPKIIKPENIKSQAVDDIKKEPAKKKEKWFGAKKPKSNLIFENKLVLDNKKDILPPKKEKTVYLDINLIPEDLGKMPERRFPEKIILSGVILSGLLLLIIFTYLGLTWYQIIITRQIQDVKDEISIIDEKIKTYKDDEKNAKELQARLLLIQSLLDQHIYWTKFFSLLEKYTIDEVYYTNFSMSGRDRLVIAAVGKDYTSAAKQLLVFSRASDFVKSVRIDGATALAEKTGEYAGVAFSINLEFQPGVFLKPVE